MEEIDATCKLNETTLCNWSEKCRGQVFDGYSDQSAIFICQTSLLVHTWKEDRDGLVEKSYYSDLRCFKK